MPAEVLEEGRDRVADRFGGRQEGPLEALRLGRDPVRGTDAPDWRVEVVEGFELDAGDDLIDEAADEHGLAAQ